MGFDQKGPKLIRVVRNANGTWDVCEAGFEKPLATFDDKRSAENYACALAESTPGAEIDFSGGLA